jgi:hypothetical protein
MFAGPILIVTPPAHFPQTILIHQVLSYSHFMQKCYFYSGAEQSIHRDYQTNLPSSLVPFKMLNLIILLEKTAAGNELMQLQ